MPSTGMMPTPSQCLSLLPKLSDADADLRYMSLNDLYNLLNAGPPSFLSTDYHTCAKIIDGILITLDDQNGEVQNQAMKCVGALVLKLPADILAPFILRVSNLKTTNSVDSSISMTALRTFINAFPAPLPGLPPSNRTLDAYLAISRMLIPRLLGFHVVSAGSDNLPAISPGLLDLGGYKGVNTDATDVLLDVIRSFGPLLRDLEKDALQQAAMTMLEDQRTSSVVKKKAVTALSILAIYLSNAQLKSFMSRIVELLKGHSMTLARERLLLTLLGSLARSIPQRIGPYLKDITPYILSPLSEHAYEQALQSAAEDGEMDGELEEAREAALIALEGCLACCSNDMRPYTTDVLNSILRYVVYNPNSAVEEDTVASDGMDDEDEINGGTDDLDDEEDDYEQDGAFSDDEDSSWKIRRCAAKALHALVSTRCNGDLLEDGIIYDKIAPVLICRFKEREENVRLEILSTLSLLVRKTGYGVLPSGAISLHENESSNEQSNRSRKRRRVDSLTDSQLSSGAHNSLQGLNSPIESPSPTSGPRADLKRVAPSIVKGVSALLVQSSISTKQAAVSLLRDLVLVQHGGLSDFLDDIIEPLTEIIKSFSHTTNGAVSTTTSSAAAGSGGVMRIEALQLAGAICDTHSSRILAPSMTLIVPSIVTAIQDRYYKVSSEAFLACESVIKAITPPRTAGSEQQRSEYIITLYNAIFAKCSVHDVDLEVRQRAIHALGVLIARVSGTKGSSMLASERRAEGLSILQDRLTNETTRLAAVRAVDLITSSTSDSSELKPVWSRAVALELGAQLRKADRTLRTSSVLALKNFVSNRIAISKFDDTTVVKLTGMLLPLISISDLNLLDASLVILTKLVAHNPQSVVNTELVKTLCTIVLSPMGGRVFESFIALVETIGEQQIGQALMRGLLQDVGVSGDPSVVGKTIGTLLVSGGSKVGVKIQDFEGELRSTRDQQRSCLALAVLGEAGFRLGTASPLKPETFDNHFKSRSELVPRAAAIALGRAGASNIQTYMPVILANITSPGQSQYLSLYSIKEILQNAGNARADISPSVMRIWDSLLIASRSNDNKTLAAECIGRLAIIDPVLFLPKLQGYLEDPTTTIRGMTIQALRFTFADSDGLFDEVIRPMLANMLSLMFTDPNIENRRLALSALNAAIQHKSEIVLPNLTNLLPFVMKDSKIDQDLIREVQMGPFRHKVDDGLELRKSAYETLFSLMESAYPYMNHTDLFDRVVAGLGDEYEIKMLCNLMLTKLIVLDPDETSRRLDLIAEKYRAIVSFKTKDNAVKQELEKAAEATKAALKVTVRLHAAFPAASSSGTSVQAQAWKGYWEWLGKEHRGMLVNVENEVNVQAA